MGPPGSTWQAEPGLAGVPVYLSTSKVDPFVPPARVRETAEWLEASGAVPQVQIFETREHRVSDEEIIDVRRMLGALS